MNYWATFDENLGYEPASLYRRINEAAEEKICLNVHVRDAASASASLHAREILAQHQATGAQELVSAVAEEFSAYGHQWKPDLRYLGPLSPEQTQLAEFQYGFLLFGRYATTAEVGHLIQAKRARLFAAGSVNERIPGYAFDATLRERLQKIVESEEKRFGVMLNLDACPTFHRISW